MKQAHTESLDSSVLASIAVILSSQFIAPHRADPGGAPPDEIYQTTNLYHSRHSQHCDDNFTLAPHNPAQLGSQQVSGDPLCGEARPAIIIALSISGQDNDVMPATC